MASWGTGIINVKHELRSVDGAPRSAPALEGRARLDSVDLLRGLVMVIMALDHTRGFFTGPSLPDPTDLSRTTLPLFLTRWITHYCAPTFVFLAGSGGYLYGARTKRKPQLAWFLFSRGLWIVILELTVVRTAWFFNFTYSVTVLQVIWAIGWSMVVLAVLCFLPTSVVAVYGLGVIAFHNLLDAVRPDDIPQYVESVLGYFHSHNLLQNIRPEHLGWLRELWMIVESTGFVQVAPGYGAFAAYPILPWSGIMAAGYACGALLCLPQATRRRQLLGLGLALTILFVLLRAGNRYGDPKPWSTQQDGVFTVLSFLNCHKYPPSLLFALMTLGPSVALLAVFDRSAGLVGRVLITFGRVPLFYYVLHFFTIHAVALALALIRHGHAEWFYKDPPSPRPDEYGYDLPIVYLIWLLIVTALYFPCRWFAGVKERRRDWWLSYL
jgi:uncharacterized membrane protein